MRNNFLTIVLVLISLVVGEFISYLSFFRGDDYALIIALGLIISLIVGVIIYSICIYCESITTETYQGEIVDRRISPRLGYLIEVRDIDNDIISIEIEKNQYYNEPMLKVGTQVTFERYEGVLTGDGGYELISF